MVNFLLRSVFCFLIFRGKENVRSVPRFEFVERKERDVRENWTVGGSKYNIVLYYKKGLNFKWIEVGIWCAAATLYGFVQIHASWASEAGRRV